MISKAGKDKGRYFVIVGVDLEGDRLVLCDGEKRSIERPKKKNIIHVQFTNQFLEDIRNMLLRGEIPSNSEVRSGLRRLTKKEGGV
ncbi:MAG: KOW domain-containing RNA-binding protein [Synergistetes bacterium]|nr:MAG: Ribosomal protein L14E [bacterium 42_11]MBC7331671.1 KOW domain-containing RNA-binding protein [Synergistota bacterium]MDK2872017.1 hypothetical protein [bacterium]